MRKFIVLLLCFVIIMAPIVKAAFPDVGPDFWAAGYIEELTSKGIINGMGYGTFAPNETLTKGQLLKLIMVASLPNVNFSYITPSFNHWAAPYVKVAENYMILEPGEINKDNIDDPITRIDVVRIMSLCDVEVRQNEQKGAPINTFKDISELNTTQLILLGHAVGTGIISGYPDGTFKPGNSLTRAEAAKMLSVYLNMD